ncbi:MAG TPA: alpha-hydroxy acid oxidase [Trebonia sp.]|jgi:isopentenyl diphosphate isomerase/L-lactate dehydrogenase-like FMN-dependent dehydrogenase|nr:alpha-hydroxy acid oxidase [Trebonia sp.]
MDENGDPVTVTSTYPRDAEFVALEQIHAAAMRRLPPDAAVYLESGAGTESTLRANREAFGRWVIRPRPMSGVSAPDTSTTFLGMPLSVPVLTAPFGGDGLFWPDGHQSVARANAAAGVLSIVPEVGTFSYETVREAAPQAARIAQVHPYESFPYAAKRIKEAGYDALCVTVDCPMTGFRVRNKMAQFRPGYGIWAGNRLDDGTPAVNDMFRLGISAENQSWTWEQLAAAAADQDLPWIAKGILTSEAARAALEAGASAILVSNHGGRQIDPAPASLDVLPEIAATVAGRAPVLLDSGVRTGADVLLALALGADAVVIGRLAAYGLAAAGEAGVRRTIELLTDELRTLMILAGIPDVASVTRDMVAPR